MRKFKFYTHSGLVGSDRHEIMEFEDDVTDEEVEEAYWDWVSSYVEFSWWELDEDDDGDDD